MNPNKEQEMIIMNIIIHSGSCRSYSMEAIGLAKEGKLEEAAAELEKASEEISAAHKVQTGLIQKEARGERTDVSLMMVHAQDHLMNALVVRDLAREFVHLYERLGQ